MKNERALNMDGAQTATLAEDMVHSYFVCNQARWRHPETAEGAGPQSPPRPPTPPPAGVAGLAHPRSPRDLWADVDYDVHHDWGHLCHAVSVLSHDRILSVAREVLGLWDPIVGNIADVATDALTAACRATSA